MTHIREWCWGHDQTRVDLYPPDAPAHGTRHSLLSARRLPECRVPLRVSETALASNSAQCIFATLKRTSCSQVLAALFLASDRMIALLGGPESYPSHQKQPSPAAESHSTGA